MLYNLTHSILLRALLQVNDTLHLYFVDFKSRDYSVYHATAPASTGSPPIDFAYQGVVVPEKGRIVNDVKAVNGFYLMGMHHNGQEVFYSASHSPSAFPRSSLLFSHHGAADQFIVSLGL